ncbi:hypothetical protein FFLO_05216 [Filobasidium floriforme]|uniref:Uncharacterized protein n=1 Tax=Filobasidium floriforme TaxID=5210 RepID=A0A8K0NNE9_9TREE|nr:uncharacterized protein HD553DRAFT_322759 [Filobasidium floriforme]KAG7530168.1 hypothetical protein FFLO_05216 [Filobasidium floriforme]KAH8087251.1 hypothetical protein HD553DRAFT_322759 [Filobasidium floriforme]
MAPISLLSAFPSCQLGTSRSLRPTTATSDFSLSFTGSPAPSFIPTDDGAASSSATSAAWIPEVIDQILTSRGDIVEVKHTPTVTDAVGPVPTVSQIIQASQMFIREDGTKLRQEEVKRLVKEHTDSGHKIHVHHAAIPGAKYVEYLMIFVVGSAVGAVILACIDECRSSARDKKDKKED